MFLRLLSNVFIFCLRSNRTAQGFLFTKPGAVAAGTATFVTVTSIVATSTAGLASGSGAGALSATSSSIVGGGSAELASSL